MTEGNPVFGSFARERSRKSSLRHNSPQLYAQSLATWARSARVAFLVRTREIDVLSLGALSKLLKCEGGGKGGGAILPYVGHL